MIIRCGLVLLFLSCVKTTTINKIYSNELVGSSDVDRIFSYSFWPSMHNGAKMMKLRKREVHELLNEGGGLLEPKASSPPPPNNPTKSVPTTTTKPETASGNGNTNKTPSAAKDVKNEKSNVPVTGAVNTNATTEIKNKTTDMPVVSENSTKHNETVAKANAMDLNNPGVLTRALIVFGGFALMAGAYLIFYKRKGKNNETSSTHGINDANQFRYGILQSEDRRDNLELSRVPLTMESDEDEDDDLEIFDLEQKKKSLSYVNLQTHDEDVVFSNSENARENDRDNLLLDIEDASLDTLINWSNNGNKSIL